MEKILKKLKKYRVEAVILGIAFVIAVASGVVYLKTYQDDNEELIETSPTSPTAIFVDISGAVNKPDSYEASNGIRLKEIVKKAGGLSEAADKNFFARNFNLAKVVTDQEKIYIPSVWEVSNGYFSENQQTLDYVLPTNNQTLININSAPIDELDTLPGVGKVTAQKIVDNRPFGALEELLDKKIVNKTVFENIKDLIII